MVTLNAKQIRDLLNYVNPDGPEYEDQMETDVSIDWMESRTSEEGEPMSAGYYAWLTEYPEEGVYGPLG